MEPKRTTSEIGKMIAEMSRQMRAAEKIPLDDLQNFTNLLEVYAKVVKAVYRKQPDASTEKKSGGKLTREEVEEWILQNGTPGAYEQMHGEASKSGGFKSEKV